MYVFVPVSVRPEATLSVSVMGGSRGPLDDTCSTLLGPPPAGVEHCPYVGEDIFIFCTADTADGAVMLSHPGVDSSDGIITYTDAMVSDSTTIDGLYTCIASKNNGSNGCTDEVQTIVLLFGEERSEFDYHCECFM